jgi:poly-gamma-glutamate capsule biosynthesis protein CapA/YwtB (metallophosphatase superfamily)
MNKNAKNVSHLLSRRALLGTGVAMLAGAAAARGRAAAQTPSVRGGSDLRWKIVLGGESAVVRRFSFHNESDFMGVMKLLRESDLTYVHLEMNLANRDELQWSSTQTHGGSYMVGPGYMANELKWAGVDAVSGANNHSYDWGAPGLLATIKYLEAAGVACAGIGFDLEQARQPVFVDKLNGRASLIACATGNGGTDWATLPKGGVPGRPGTNPLRVDWKYMVDRASADQLLAVFRKMGMMQGAAAGAKPPTTFAVGAQDPATPGVRFEVGDHCGIEATCHKGDLEANLRSINEANKLSDLVLVAQHNSASDAGRRELPSKYVVEFAHAAIDAGADIYIGHGWHKTLGIELYKGKPIIYGIGNLFYGSEFIDIIPYDNYAAYGHDVDKLPLLNPVVGKLHASERAESGEDLYTWWSSNILVLTMEHRKLVRLELYPVETGVDIGGETPVKTRFVGPNKITDGTPFLAHGACARKILERARKVSAQHGTKIEIDGEVGRLKL